MVLIPALLRKRGWGFGAEAVQGCGPANIELVAKRSLVSLPLRVCHDCLYSAHLLPHQLLCTALSWDPWEMETKHSSFQSIWNPLS